MSTVLKPFIELPYGTKFRYQGSEEVWVRTQHNVIAGWSPNLIQSGHQSLCAFCALEGDEDGNTLQTLVEVVGDQPAQQHHGEPVALPERKQPRPQGDWTSPETYRENLGWNACLDEIAKLGPLYQRTDAEFIALLERDRKAHCGAIHSQAGELAELRKENEHLRAGWYKDESDNNRFWPEELQEAKSELAERDALLQDLLDYDISANARRRIEEALSIVAELKVKS